MAGTEAIVSLGDGFADAVKRRGEELDAERMSGLVMPDDERKRLRWTVTIQPVLDIVAECEGAATRGTYRRCTRPAAYVLTLVLPDGTEAAASPRSFCCGHHLRSEAEKLASLMPREHR